MKPGDLLREGRVVLDPLFRKYGIECEVQAGKGSGGSFVVGRYSNGERSVDLHVRWGLGIVEYRVGESFSTTLPT